MTKAPHRGRRPGLSHSHRGTSSLLSGFRVPGCPSVGGLPQQTRAVPASGAQPSALPHRAGKKTQKDSWPGHCPAASSGPAFPTATRHRASRAPGTVTDCPRSLGRRHHSSHWTDDRQASRSPATVHPAGRTPDSGLLLSGPGGWDPGTRWLKQVSATGCLSVRKPAPSSVAWLRPLS